MSIVARPWPWLLLAAAAAAQDPLERDLAFARGLADDFGAIALARDEIARLQQQYRGAGDQDRIALLAAEVACRAARVRGDRGQQRANYSAAFERSRELCARASDGNVLLRARTTLAAVAEDYAAFLRRELELARPADAAAARELQDEQQKVCAQGSAAIEQALRELAPQRGRDPARQQLHDRCWLRQGVLQRELARCSPGDRIWLLGRARSGLADLVLEVGEETALGLRGLFEIALCDELAGDRAAAAAGYAAAADKLATALGDAQKRRFALPKTTFALLFDLLQEVAAQQAASACARGDATLARQVLERLRQQLATFAAPGQDPLDACTTAGHRALLLQCELQCDDGDAAAIASALQTARAIAQRHGADHTGLQARALLRSLLRRHGAAATAPLWLDLARGELRDKDFDAAQRSCRRALACGPADAPAPRLEALLLLGRACRLGDRGLEAVVTLQNALDEPALRGADLGPLAATAARLADELDRALAACRATGRADAVLEPLFDAGRKALLRWGSDGGADRVQWQTGNDALARGDFAAATAAFAAIPVDSTWHARARARTAQAQLGRGDLDGARATVAAFRAWLATAPAAPPTQRDDRAAAVREIDWAEAMLAWQQAYGDERSGRKKDLGGYDAAIALLRAFLANHGGVDDGLSLQALDALARLFADRGELAAADEALAQLQARDPVRGSRLDAALFAAYSEHARHLQDELAAAQQAGREANALERLRRDLRKAQVRLQSLGLDYLRTAPQPQLPLLLHAAEASMQLDEPGAAAELLTRALQTYGASTDADTQALVDRGVRPRLGEALRRLGRFQQACDVLLEAERRAPHEPEIARLLSLCLGGWCTLDATGRVVRETALGQPAAAFDKYWTDYRPHALRADAPSFTLAWYRCHLEALWFAQQAAANDSRYQRWADALFRTARSTDDFAALKALGDDGQRLFHLFVELNR